MRVSLIKRLLIEDGEYWFRKDTTLPVLPTAGVDLYVKRNEGVHALPESFEDRVSPEMRSAIVEGSDRVVVYLDPVMGGGDFAIDYGPVDRTSASAWMHWFCCYGFEPTEYVDPMKMTPWGVRQKTTCKAETPRHASPCCGMESVETGQVGTAFLYTCVGCRQTWHYAGGRKLTGTPQQQEPGVHLPDAFSAVDPTAPTKMPWADGGASRAERPQGLVGHDYDTHPDGFPGTDEGSHYMSQTKIDPRG